jgi:hypothetical protein
MPFSFASRRGYISRQCASVVRQSNCAKASAASTFPMQICMVTKGFWLAPPCPQRLPGRAAVAPRRFQFAGRHARRSFHAVQFRSPTWLHFKTMCVGRETKQRRGSFRREHISDASMHGRIRFWLTPLLPSAPPWTRRGGPETLACRRPARQTTLACHSVSRPGWATFAELVCRSKQRPAESKLRKRGK